ncbi:MAG: lacZ [Acidobacteria bacterium]|nr:lacZ [Acidobacteriota bacterium]
MKIRRIVLICLAAALAGTAAPVVSDSQTTASEAKSRLSTRWAADVRADRVLPEYPRPQMVRPEWRNLNGLWQYAIAPREAQAPSAFTGQILVPFPVESALSGVARAVSPEQHLWYRRTFDAPRLADGARLLLHFGAVDWEAVVSVNGRPVGEHRGGYDPFTFDITGALAPEGPQEIVVRVWDPTNKGMQPRGKQVLNPRGIWYTAVTGIWQTVWLETVPSTYVESLRIDPDVDAGALRIRVQAAGAEAARAGGRVQVLDGARVVAEGQSAPGETIAVRMPDPRLWSPADPFLYNLKISLSTGDAVASYAGMRKISVGRDAAGVNRLFLNNKPLFQYGQLDQGWWPDGLYTAPTDEALRFDVEMQKKLGFNTIRKHVKVEPARWYYHCDHIGMLVWQDMPSGDNKTPGSREDFLRELGRMVAAHRNSPSIVMWVPFNEGWGQHDTERYAAYLKQEDPTRLVNNASGWEDRKVGDVSDGHSYPGPAMPPTEPARASVIGEFGGLGLPLESHTWLEKGNWGYRSFTTAGELGAAYRNLLYQLRLQIGQGAAAAIYTQTTDVEIEVNGIMTYDRAVVKLPAGQMAQWHAALYEPPPGIRTVLPAADTEPAAWRYTTAVPGESWFRPEFDDSAWTEGRSGFGSIQNARARVNTPWKSPDLWIRRTFELKDANLANPHLRIFHDDAAEVYLNGEQVAKLDGNIGTYFCLPLGEAGAKALRRGTNTLAVHVHQDRGGQYIDAGLVEVIGK